MSLWSRRNAGFIVIEAGGTDGAGTHAGDQIIFDGDGAGVAAGATGATDGAVDGDLGG